MKKRIILKMALTVPEEMTVAQLVERFGQPREGKNLHVDYKAISAEEAKTYVMKDGEMLAYSSEL